MNIRTEIEKRGWDWHEFAVLMTIKGCNISETRLRRVCNGRTKNVKPDEVAMIARLLKVKAEEVLQSIKDASEKTLSKMALAVAVLAL